ncbi:DAK2 domain-containing protein [Streptomyces sp. URMC 123]|uniref:DAK2 domain-containing protein n=1 Tax=Streptomyces sp. URMC 123 TaxID=3423403 RepID=UPI003F1A55BB
MPHTVDATVVRSWCTLALEALGRSREDIDAINVYPVADGDTGTNLYLTVESAAHAVDAVFAAHATVAAPHEGPALPDALRAMAHGALIGARGNSGTILAQLLRGMAEVLAGHGGGVRRAPGAQGLRDALRRAAESAYQAVAHPVEGTMLSVATAAAEAAGRAPGESSTAQVARAAYEGARTALEATPEQLAVLGRAGVVDAGGCGLVAVLGALAEAVSGRTRPTAPAAPPTRARRGAPAQGGAQRVAVPGPSPAPYDSPMPCEGGVPLEGAGCPAAAGAPAGDAGTAGAAGSPAGPAGPAYEVIYLLDADDAAVAALRTRLDGLGDSLVIVGGDGLWNVHVHVDDAGAAVEAGIEAGRPHRVRITHFGAERAGAEAAARADARAVDAGAGRARPPAPAPRAERAVVVVVPGDGLAGLCAEAGATVVTAAPGDQLASGELAHAIRRAHAREVVLLPNDPALRHTAAVAAEQARADGVRVAVIPTRSPVQGIAALAVHEPGRSFDEDVVAMTAAAGATRFAELAVAESRSWTMAGVCQAGDVLGLIDGDVAVIGSAPAETAVCVLDRMLAAGGEMVTLVLGAGLPAEVGEALQAHVRRGHLAVDTVVYRGGQQSALLLIGVE